MGMDRSPYQRSVNTCTIFWPNLALLSTFFTEELPLCMAKSCPTLYLLHRRTAPMHGQILPYCLPSSQKNCPYAQPNLALLSTFFTGELPLCVAKSCPTVYLLHRWTAPMRGQILCYCLPSSQTNCPYARPNLVLLSTFFTDAHECAWDIKARWPSMC